MIPESARDFIQAVGQLLFQETSKQMAGQDWEKVALNVRYDGTGNFVRTCVFSTGTSSVDPSPLELTDAIDAPLHSLEANRIDTYGKEWSALSVTISKVGEVKINLAYAEE